MSRDRELQLREAIDALAAVWRDERDTLVAELLEPVSAEELRELDERLGMPLPPPARILLERWNGSFVRVSPCRPDVLMSAFVIGLQLDDDPTVVPLIECGLDPETGLTRTLGMTTADPWGPLRRRDGTSDVTLLAWLHEVTAEHTAYTWPQPRRLVVDLEWSPCESPDRDALRRMPVGSALAAVNPRARKNRVGLNLFVHLEPDVWVRGQHRHAGASEPLVAMCLDAASDIEREIMRARSQWTLSAQQVVDALRRLSDWKLFGGSISIDASS